MEKLSEGDLRKVLGAIEILSRDVDYTTLPRRIVDAIVAVIAVDFVSYNEVDTDTGESRFLLTPDPADFEPDSFEYAAFIRRFGNHPMVAQKVATAGRENTDLQKFVNRLRFLGMVGNCCGQAELRLNMGLTVSSARTRRVGIALHRSIRDFDDHDAAKLDALRPHIVTAFRHSPRAVRSAGPTPEVSPATAALTKRETKFSTGCRWARQTAR